MKNKHSNRTVEPKSKFRKKSYYLSILTVCLILGGSIIAQTNAIQYVSQISTRLVNPTPTPTKQTNRKKRKNSSGSNAISSGEDSDNLTSPVLARTEFNLVGLAVTANPANQTVPKNTPTGILTSIRTPEGTDPTDIIAGLNPNYKIRGELVGPSLTSPRLVEASIGETINISPLQNAGDHVVQNLRVVDTGTAGDPVITSVEPDSVGITVIDNILVSQVQVTEMTYEEIVQSGINLNNSNYNFFNFVLGISTSSGTIPIQIPVALPTTGGQTPVVGNPVGGTVNGVNVPLPDIVPIMLNGVDAGGNPTPINLPGGGGMQIPGVVVFPGRIGFLNQFFEAIVIVANGAPDGTPLVITNLKARAKLPDADTPTDLSDDPLRIAETQVGGVQTQLDIHGLGADGRYGTSDDTTSFNPGQSGQATFLIEGLKEGLHTVDFDLEGTLQGLPTGDVTVQGTVPGAVLVRDAEFGVTFTHPSVVQTGQEYDLGVTIFNSGSRNLNGISLNLGGMINGATLLDSEEKILTQTIPPGGSGTVKWKLRSNKTGQVTASYIKVGEGIDAGLVLQTGVGDRNVPLSPDSLVLPESVKHLPPDVVEAARQMLGQAWSVATAPAGSLPTEVLPIQKQTVVGKAVELGWAGLRVDFHEERDTTLRTLMRDWLGENQSNSSTGFADALRNTSTGNYFFDVVGTKFYETVGQESPTEFHKKLANAESARSSFISAFVSQNSGQQIFGAKITSPANQSVGFGTNVNERFGDLRTGASLNFLQNDPRDETNNSKGNLLIVSKPTTNGSWNLEINGWADGNADISILAPTSGKNYRQLVFENVGITTGKRYRISFKAVGNNAPVVEEFINGAFRSITLPYTSVDVLDSSPEITGVVQVTRDVIEGGDDYGRLVGILFSKPMLKSSAETIDRYQIGGGELVTDPTQIVGKLIKPTGAYQNFGERFVILALDAPVGPFIKRTVAANGIVDKNGKIVNSSAIDLESRVSPNGLPFGGYVTGKVIQADGTAVPNADIYYRRIKSVGLNESCGIYSNWETVSYQKADSNGDFTIDYVRNGICHPVTFIFQNTNTNSEKTLTSNVAYNGQHLVFNAVFLARGNVQGTVTSGGIPVPYANVSILSELEPFGSKLVRTDEQGFYSATGIPVGGITVKAIGTGAYSLSSGIAAGSLSEPGATANIDVATQNVSGVIKGKVLDNGNEQSPVENSLVVAYASVSGFPSENGSIPVGYSFTMNDGSFTISGLPIGNVYLRVIDPQRGDSTSLAVPLTPQNPEVEGIILQISNGFGSVSGTVLNELGQPIPSAYVQEGLQTVQADSGGNYSFQRIREGNASITAIDPNTGLRGYTTISVRRNEAVTGANVIVRSPANINGQVFITENGVTNPLAQAYVTVDGRIFAQTDSQGAYTLNSVPSGLRTIRFVYPQKRQVVNTQVFLSPGDTVTRNATFRPGRVYGQITQPDGVTPAIGTVSISTTLPSMSQGSGFGLVTQGSLSVQTNSNGEFAFDNLNPGLFRINASSVLFPTSVWKSGNLLPNGNLEVNLSLVDGLTGKVQGRIFRSDGTTPVGSDVRVSLGNGTLGDVFVKTNNEGFYEFEDVFSEGNYELTATDTVTGKTNRKDVYILKNQDININLRLLGKGTLSVRAIDASNNPITDGTLEVQGNNYPNDARVIELTPTLNGEFEFKDLPEGNYSISVIDTGLGGRVSANVLDDRVTEVVVQTQPIGTVTGTVLSPNGTTPVGLADVSISKNGSIIGLITTDDSEEDRGKFTFQAVPSGTFTIDVFDNRSGRRGRAFGEITQQGQIITTDVTLLALGKVIGKVTSNEIPVEHALVTIRAFGSGISYTNRVATTDSEGNYRFTGIPVGSVNVSVQNGPGGLTGYASGNVIGTIEPLPDTVIDVALTPSASFIGTVYKIGGTEGYSGASVNIKVGRHRFNTITDENGSYQIDFVPLGDVEINVEAPFGFDRGKSAVISSEDPGATITTDITMTGVGNITGVALDNNGSPLSSGIVEFTNNDWGEPISLNTPVGEDGTFSLSDLPTGDFNLKLTVSNRIGVGTVNGNLVGNQTFTTNLQLEAAGKVFGFLKNEDGTTPSVGADAVLSLTRIDGSSFNFYTRTNMDGYWEFNNIPLGSMSIGFSDPVTEGFVRIYGLSLASNGQEIDVGDVVLNSSQFMVSSVNPSDDAVNVPTNAALQVVFNEPVDQSSLNSSSIKLRNQSFQLSTTLSVSPDGRTVTITPSNLQQLTNYTIEVLASVRNIDGAPLQTPFVSSFRTADETAPHLTGFSPEYNATELPLDTLVSVSFDEELDPNQNFSEVIKVVPVIPTGSAVSGVYELSEDQKTVLFTPSALSANTKYKVDIVGQTDVYGNTQSIPNTLFFYTVDTLSPTIGSYNVDNKPIANGLIITKASPQFAVAFGDNLSINQSETKLYLAKQGQTLQVVSTAQTANLINYYPAQPLTEGNYVTKVVVTDLAGNQTTSPEYTFTINPQTPEIVSINPNTGSLSGNTITTIAGRNLVIDTAEPDVNARGLLGKYSSNSFSFSSKEIFTRIDDKVDFELYEDSFTPYFPDGDTLAVNWSGKIIPQYSEEYNFTIEYTGRMRLTINNQLIIDPQDSETVKQASGSITLVAGQAYDILIEHSPIYLEYDSGYGKDHVAKLSWSSSSQPLEIVPTEQLRPAPQDVLPTVLVGGQPAFVIGTEKTEGVNTNDYVTILTPYGFESFVPVEVQNGNGSDIRTEGFQYTFDNNGPSVAKFAIRENTPQHISVYFNEPLLPNQNFDNVVNVYNVTAGEIAVAGSITLDETGRKLTFVPNDPFAENVEFRINVVNQQDIIGNVTYFSEEENFSIDRIAPEIFEISPDGINVDNPTPRIKIYFRDGLSEIDTNSAFLTVDGNDVSNQLSFYDDYFEYRTFTALALGSHTYTARIADEDGNVAERSGSFTIVSDTNPPVISRFSINGKEAVEGLKVNNRYPNVQVVFNDTGEEYLPSYDQKLYFGSQASELTLVRDYAGQTQEGYVLEYYPPQQELGFYSVRAELTDSLGNATSRTVNFEITDEVVTQLEVVSVNPTAQQNQVPIDSDITVNFNGELDPNQNFSESIQITEYDLQTGNQTIVLGNYLINAEGTSVTFTPNSSLSENTYYFVLVNGYLDLAGNVGQQYQSYFVTTDTMAPVLSTLRLRTDQETVDLNNAQITFTTPTIEFGFSDNLTGIDGNSIVFTIDGVNTSVTNDFSGLTYTPQTPLELGNHTITVQIADNAGNLSEVTTASFQITEVVVGQRRIPFSVEDDTVLLWHLDDIDNNGIALDSSPYLINGSSSNSNVTPITGRFGDGLKNPKLLANNDSGVLAFGANSFSVEAWIQFAYNENSPPTAPFTVLSRSIGSQKEFALILLPNGDLKAQIVNSNTDVWEIILPKATFNIGDNKWHSLAMVVERGSENIQNQLKIYADGVLQISSQSPVGFGAIRNVGGRFQLSPEKASLGINVDEVRISNTAHTSEQIQRNYNPDDLGLVVLRGNPAIIQRGAESEISLEGYNLENITATITDYNGSLTTATTDVINPDTNSANVKITLDEFIPLGEVNLNISSDTQTVTLPLRVVNQQPFLLDANTILLWHMDETNFGTVVDSGTFGLDGVSYSEIVDGRFGNGKRGNIRINSNTPQLNFGNNNFTVEGWFKGNLPQVSYGGNIIFSKGDFSNSTEVYSLQLLESGKLQARLYDSGQRTWTAFTNPQQIRVDDNKWHYLSMVVKRGVQPNENTLSIFVDGIERSSTQIPSQFTDLRSANGGFTAGGNQGFIIDEVRVLNVARTSESILNTWLGSESNFSQRLPKSIKSNATTSKDKKNTSIGKVTNLKPNKLTGKLPLTDQKKKRETSSILKK